MQIAEATSAPVLDGPASEWPWYTFEAVSRAMQICSWMEHLTEDEMPPENIWHHSEALKGHFTALKARRRANNGSSPAYEPVPDPETTVSFDNSDILRQLLAP